MRFLKLLLLQAMLVVVLPVMAQLSIDSSTLCPSFAVDGRTMITTPDEGLWAVATKWENDWMTDWVYAKPERRAQHYMMLQRNLLYTGMTRARKLLILIGSRKAVEMAVKNIRLRPRYSRLSEKLKAAAGCGKSS